MNKNKGNISTIKINNSVIDNEYESDDSDEYDTEDSFINDDSDESYVYESDVSDESFENESDESDEQEYINKMAKLDLNKVVKASSPPPKKTYRKKAIPATVKRIVWNNYIGEHIGKTKCYCCKLTDIIQMSFHCGHVISEKNRWKNDC